MIANPRFQNQLKYFWAYVNGEGAADARRF